MTLLFAFVAFLVTTSSCSCGSNSQDGTWLISVSSDTLTTTELGEEWRSLDDSGRERFLSGNNPVGNYLVAVSRREVLKRELEELGYFDSERTIAFGNLWRRIEGAIACREFLTAKAIAAISSEDLDNYRYFLGTSVWYTINPEQQDATEEGPVHLAELPFNLAFCLDSIELDETAESIGGLTVRLDSVVKTAPELVADAIADTMTFNETAISRISSGRVRRQYLLWQETMYDEYNIRIDSSAVLELAEYHCTPCSINTNTIIIKSDFRDWSIADMEYEIEFADTRMPTQPSTPQWLYFLMDNMLIHHILNNVLADEAPHIVDSIAVESESWILEMVAEELFQKVMEERIQITDDDIEYEFENLAAPIIIEEMRILEIALLPFDRIDEYEAAVAAGNQEQILTELPGYAHLQADSSGNRITIPVKMSEVPGGYGSEVFDIAPDNTTKWAGPFTLSESLGSALFRLVEVIPSREATFEECYPTLMQNAQTRIGELVLMQWLQELEEKYNLQINEEALSDLPDDPALWR